MLWIFLGISEGFWKAHETLKRLCPLVILVLAGSDAMGSDRFKRIWPDFTLFSTVALCLVPLLQTHDSKAF